jgi:TonB family protein
MTCRPGSLRGQGRWCLLLVVFFACIVAPAEGQDAARKLVKKVDAQYPAALKHRGIGGTVKLKVYIKADGAVRDSEVLGGSAALADAAQKAVGQWKFAPAAADSVMEVSIVFNPNEQ